MKKIFAAGLIVAGALLPVTAHAISYQAAPARSAPVMRVGGAAHVLAPMAHVIFCARNPAQCATEGTAIVDDSLATLATLDRVNRQVNAAIAPRIKSSGPALGNWELAPAAGDCNDYAVTKRQQLLAQGLSARALLLAHVRTSWGEDHLVLVVRTPGADYVLDNLRADIRPAQASGYRWVRIQSQDDLALWHAARVTVERAPVVAPPPAAPSFAAEMAILPAFELRGSQTVTANFERDIAGASN